MSETRLILHVKGTEQETTTLPKKVVRAAISCGQLTHSQLIWSPEENTWKQVRELPELLPSQKLAPAPAPRATVTLPTKAAVTAAAQAQPQVQPQPHAASVPRAAASGSVPRAAAVQPQPSIQSQPTAQSKPSAQKPAMRPTKRVQVGQQPSPSKTQSLSHLVKNEQPAHPMKWICFGVAGLILFLLAVNYFLIDRPLNSRLDETSYGDVSVYAHLAGYIEPSVILIHISAKDTVDESKFTDFLVALARSTPHSPLGGGNFEHVELTSGWTGQYSFSGFAWQQLGQMQRSSADERKEYILDQICDGSGQPLVTYTSSNSESARHDQRENVWKGFVAQFVR